MIYEREAMYETRRYTVWEETSKMLATQSLAGLVFSSDGPTASRRRFPKKKGGDEEGKEGMI